MDATGSFSGIGRAVKLTTVFYLVLKLRIRGAIPPISLQFTSTLVLLCEGSSYPLLAQPPVEYSMQHTEGSAIIKGFGDGLRFPESSTFLALCPLSIIESSPEVTS